MTLSKQTAAAINKLICWHPDDIEKVVAQTYAPLVEAVLWLKMEYEVWTVAYGVSTCRYCDASIAIQARDSTAEYVKRRVTLHKDTCSYKVRVLDVVASLVEEEPCQKK